MAERESAPDGTRERIMDAALDLFGERGLTGTTVRDIAAAANVNVAAISYHFGGKDELYRAVAEAVVAGMDTRIRGRAGALLTVAPSSPDEALAMLEKLLCAIVDVVVGPQEMRRVARFIIREQMQPTAAFEILFATMSRLHAAACGLFAAATGLQPDAAGTRLRVFLFLGQALFFRLAEAAVLRRMDLERYDEAFLASVKAALGQNLRALVAAVREEGA